MKGRVIQLLLLSVLGACVNRVTLATDSHITDKGDVGRIELQTISSLANGFATGKLAGALHPAVLEYLFATPTGPFRAYFDALLRAGPSKADGDARELSSSSPPTGEHYARASARRMSEAANKAFVGAKLPKNVDGHRGYACLKFTKRVDRKTGTLVDAELELVVMIHEGARVLHVISGPNDFDYTWDLQYVANAFDPTKPLDYETVVRLAVPLHGDEALR